jgi:hypothetical protein
MAKDEDPSGLDQNDQKAALKYSWYAWKTSGCNEKALARSLFK